MSEGEPQHEVTRLIQAAGSSDRAAADQLLALVYAQLRKIARQRMSGEHADHTLQATALVHEAYLRLIGKRKIAWGGRAHFFSAAAEAMRRILLDHAKAKGRVKRGAARKRAPLSVAAVAAEQDPAEILSLDEALCRLKEHDGQIGEVVQLRYYAGLSIDETADALGISKATVKRYWEFGRTWLFRDLSRGD